MARKKKAAKAKAKAKPKMSPAAAGSKSQEGSADEQYYYYSARDASMPAALETWRTRGNQAYADGQFASAEEHYTCGINSLSHALMLCYSNRAAARMSLGRMREALQDCLSATSIDPTFLKAELRAAKCQLALGYLKDASRSYTTFLESNNTELNMVSEAYDGLERVKIVTNWMSQSKDLLKKTTLPEATTALELICNALQMSPHSDNLMEMKAEALLMLGRYEEVIQLCEETVDLAKINSTLFNANGESRNSSASKERMSWNALAVISHFDGRTSRQHLLSLATTIKQLLSFKASGNKSFQARRYSEAMEQYSAALAFNSDSRPFSAICYCNRAAAYHALGQVTNAIADCSLAIALDENYPRAISRRANFYELIRDYGQAADDLRRLISLLEKQDLKPELSPNVCNKHKDLEHARARLLSVEEAKNDTPLNLYLILGVESCCSSSDIKKAYRKAALKHHPDKANQFLVRKVWWDVAKAVHANADLLFKTIGEAYSVLSNPRKRQKYDTDEMTRNTAKI